MGFAGVQAGGVLADVIFQSAELLGPDFVKRPGDEGLEFGGFGHLGAGEALDQVGVEKTGFGQVGREIFRVAPQIGPENGRTWFSRGDFGGGMDLAGAAVEDGIFPGLEHFIGFAFAAQFSFAPAEDPLAFDFIGLQAGGWVFAFFMIIQDFLRGCDGVFPGADRLGAALLMEFLVAEQFRHKGRAGGRRFPQCGLDAASDAFLAFHAGADAGIFGKTEAARVFEVFATGIGELLQAQQGLIRMASLLLAAGEQDKSSQIQLGIFGSRQLAETPDVAGAEFALAATIEVFAFIGLDGKAE